MEEYDNFIVGGTCNSCGEPASNCVCCQKCNRMKELCKCDKNDMDKIRIVAYANGIIIREFCVYGSFSFQDDVLKFNIDNHTFYLGDNYLVEREINWSPTTLTNQYYRRHSGTVTVNGGQVYDIIFFELFDNYIAHFITTDNREIFFKGSYIADIQK